MKKKSFLLLITTLVLFSLFMVPAMAVPSNEIETLELTREDSATEDFDKFTSDALGLLGDTSSMASVIIETTTHDYDLVENLVSSFGGIVNYAYENIDGASVNIPASALLALAKSPLISKIYHDDLKEMNILKEEVNAYSLMSDASINVSPISTEIAEAYPSTYVNSYLTNAEAIWGETNYGDGVSVAIIDTGCWDEPWVDPNYSITHYPWYWDQVYAGVDLSSDVGTPYEGYGNPMNHYHGTACAALIAAEVILTFPLGDSWGEAIAAYDPSGTWTDASGIHILCQGIAPSADIYAVKVFDHTGAGVPSSKIMEGIDAAISEGVDVISMSLGGGVGAPGVDPEDLLVDAATAAGITVVASAGNEGPAPLKVGSPGTANTAITVGAAMDPIHENVFGNIAYGPVYGPYYYPHEEKFIADFSSRGPTSDGRIKPDVVATGSWTLFGLTPSRWPYTISIGGGTSFSCPQVAGEAVLLTAYIKNNGLDLGPTDIKEAIMAGADPLDGYDEFEQGAGYINCYNSLEVIKSMVMVIDDGILPESMHSSGYHCKSTFRCHCRPSYSSYWSPPLKLLHFHNGVTKVNKITLTPGMFNYFNFMVDEEVDSIKITLSDIVYSDDQNPAFGDHGVLYLSTAAREGIDDYYIYPNWTSGEGIIYAENQIFQLSSDVHIQPGVVRLVLAGDFSGYSDIYIKKMTIELVKVEALNCFNSIAIFNSGKKVDEAQVSIYNGQLIREYGKVKEGESDLYAFTIPDTGEDQLAILELSWYRDWSKWATSDLDLLIYQLGSDGIYHLVNVDGATGSSPEFVQLSEPGSYLIMVDGYQVYFDRNECYSLEITYFKNLIPKWNSEIFALNHWIKLVRMPRRMHGLAVLWLHDTLFDHWYIADVVKT